MNNSKWTPLLIIVIVIFLALVGGRFFYYSNGNAAYVPPQRNLESAEFDAHSAAQRQAAPDNPSVSQGVVVIDYIHENALFIDELNTLLAKIVSRGFSYEIVQSGSDSETGEGGLGSKLQYAQALILPLPREVYTPEEIVEIEQFIEKGGQLLIIGDPTRTLSVQPINSIASSFGAIYANDYLYNLDPLFHDNNYRNVIHTDFESGPLTTGLADNGKVVFYSGGSVDAPGQEIIFGHETTYSSVSESESKMAAAALTANNQVLALTDLTFFKEPYSEVESNGIFINNIADFLTDNDRSFELKDFPFFFNPNVDVVFDDALVFNSQFEDTVKLKEFLEAQERTVTVTDNIAGSNDVIFIGRFDQTETVADYLAAANISLIKKSAAEDAEEVLTEGEAETTAENEIALVSDTPPLDADQDFVEGRIQIEGVGELELGGATLFYLHQEKNRNILIILSDNPDTNADAFKLLLEGEFVNCLASSLIAVCHTEKPDKQVLPSIRSTRIDKILIVSDNDGHKREDAQTSAAKYHNVLSATYTADIWITSKDESPPLDELQEYDAVIWTTGDYWDDSIGENEVKLLQKYIDAGGNLLLSGASISFDWDHTEFLNNVVHADYVTFAEQGDIALVLDSHPLAKGFEKEAVITFDLPEWEEPLKPDVVNHTADARVVFQRGPDSKQEGAASIIAYEDDRAKIAYFAFPIYLLPNEEQTMLIDNAIDWFTRKTLDLPNEDDYTPFESNGSDEKQAQDGEGVEKTGDEAGGDGQGNGDGNGTENGDGSGSDTGNNTEGGN